MPNSLLSIKSLSISFLSKKKENKVVHNISFSLQKNEILGIVGESGSGKSVTTMAIMGLLPEKKAQISGEIIFEDKNLLDKNKKEHQKLRGNEIAMIFQEPMSALNPSMKLGKQVAEVLVLHKKLSKTEAKKQVLELFEKVKLPNPKEIFSKYPHQVSGGQMQRVMIAMAIACKPKILIADEPTTALDVTVQKEIILLLKELQKETEMSIIFISHDLALVSEIADSVLVMYQGTIVEEGSVLQIFHHPKHNYTKALIGARPTLNERLKKLPTIKDFMENTIPTTIISPQERALHHKNMYAKKPLLEVINVEKEYFSTAGFFQKKKAFKAVNRVSFSLFEGETLGFVG